MVYFYFIHNFLKMIVGDFNVVKWKYGANTQYFFILSIKRLFMKHCETLTEFSKTTKITTTTFTYLAKVLKF